MLRFISAVFHGLGIFIFLLMLALISGYITMQLAREKGKVEVPDLRGRDSVVAFGLLRKLGFQPRIVRQEYSETVPKGAVVLQRPAPGSFIHKGSEVWLIVSRGSDLAIVPDLAMVDVASAQKVLSEAGLVLGRVAKVHSDDYPKDRVIAQDPPGGSPSRLGRSVDLLISLGPEEVSYIMPDLVGRAEADVLRQLWALSLEVQVSYETHRGQEGLVLHQDPPFGVRIRAKEPVRITVGR